MRGAWPNARGCGLFWSVCSLFFPEKEKRTRKESREPAWAVPPRPPVSGAWFARKNILRGFSERKAPQGKMGNASRGGRPIDGKRTLRGGLPESFRANPSPLRFLFWGGLPDGLRASPSPIRFLFFGSFFSFPERKERTEKRKERTEKGSGKNGMRQAGSRCVRRPRISTPRTMSASDGME